MSARVLIIGGGGREDALAWKISDSKNVGSIFVTPGNAGTSSEKKTQNVCLDFNNHHEVADWCRKNGIDLVVVGPEVPLANGKATARFEGFSPVRGRQFAGGSTS